MNATEYIASVGLGSYYYGADGLRSALILAGARVKDADLHAQLQTEFLHKRRYYLNRECESQRRWQSNPRTMTRVRKSALRVFQLNDVIDPARVEREQRERLATREKYVRCR